MTARSRSSHRTARRSSTEARAIPCGGSTCGRSTRSNRGRSPAPRTRFPPFFSPDGRWIAFFSGGWLKKVEVSGGAPVPIAPAPNPRGGTWGPDDTIVFTPTTTTGLYRVAASGGTPVEITKPSENERTHRWPSFLPDGNAVVFIRQDRNAAYDDGVIEAVRLETNERKILIRGGTFPRYLASGHLVYGRENTLFAVPFDAKRLEVQGNPQPVLYGVRSSGGTVVGNGTGASQVAFSSNGRSSMSLIPPLAHTIAWSSSIGRASRSSRIPRSASSATRGSRRTARAWRCGWSTARPATSTFWTSIVRR